jgi:hypothetical protein
MLRALYELEAKVPLQDGEFFYVWAVLNQLAAQPEFLAEETLNEATRAKLGTLAEEVRELAACWEPLWPVGRPRLREERMENLNPSRILAMLVKRGLVERRRRRPWHVTGKVRLTDAGRADIQGRLQQP